MLFFRPNLFKYGILFLSLLIPINFTFSADSAEPKIQAELDISDSESSDSDESDTGENAVEIAVAPKKSDIELATEIDQVLDNLMAANLDSNKYHFLQPPVVEPTAEPIPAILQKKYVSEYVSDGELDFDLDLEKSLEQPKRFEHDSELNNLQDLELDSEI